MFDDSEFISWANENVVLLVGHMPGSHKPVDVAKPAKGEPKSHCPLYPAISCDDHEASFKEMMEGGAAVSAPKAKKGDPKTPLPKLDLKGYPSSFILTPDGKFEKHEGDRSPATCREKLVEAQKKLDEHPIPFSKFAEVKKAVDDAEAALKIGKLKPAFDACVKADLALGGQYPKAMAEAAKARLDTLNKKVAAKFAEAKRGKDPAGVTRVVKALKDEFGAALTAGPLPAIADIDAFLGIEPAPAPAPSDGSEPVPEK